MVQVLRLGHAAFATNDIDAVVAYYTDVMGLTLVERPTSQLAYLGDATDHHTVVLHQADTTRIQHVAFQVDPSRSLSEHARQLRDLGVAVEYQSDAMAGIPELLKLTDSEGNTVLLYTESAQRARGFGEHGIRPEKLGHVALCVHDIQRTVQFYQDVLGFRVSDWLEDFFVFMRCGPDHHTMNFLRSKHRNKMNHIAFQVKDWNAIQMSCDWLARHGIPLIWGPGRHGMGHNIFAYHRDPSGQIVELFTELDIMLSEELGYFEPRPWHEDYPQKPKVWKLSPQAANSWGIGPPEGFLE